MNKFCKALAVLCLVAWFVALISGFCLVAKAIAIALDKLGLSFVQLTVVCLVSFLISIVAVLLTEVFG